MAQIHELISIAVKANLYRIQFTPKSVVKNPVYVDKSCQGSAQSADLQALDSKQTTYFIIGRVKKTFFHRPPKPAPIKNYHVRAEQNALSY